MTVCADFPIIQLRWRNEARSKTRTVLANWPKTTFGEPCSWILGMLPARYQLYLTLNKNGKPAEALKEGKRRFVYWEADIRRIGEIVNGELQKRPNDPAILHEVGMIAHASGSAQRCHALVAQGPASRSKLCTDASRLGGDLLRDGKSDPFCPAPCHCATTEQVADPFSCTTNSSFLARRTRILSGAQEFERSVESFPLSPVLRGEGWGEGKTLPT